MTRTVVMCLALLILSQPIEAQVSTAAQDVRPGQTGGTFDHDETREFSLRPIAGSWRMVGKHDSVPLEERLHGGKVGCTERGEWDLLYLCSRDDRPLILDSSSELRLDFLGSPVVRLDERSRRSLVGGGIVGGMVGLGVGIAAGMTRFQVSDCDLACFGDVFSIVIIAESLGVARGVHLADGREGSFGRRALVSTGVGLVGAGAAFYGGGPVLLLIPVVQTWLLAGHRVGAGS